MILLYRSMLYSPASLLYWSDGTDGCMKQGLPPRNRRECIIKWYHIGRIEEVRCGAGGAGWGRESGEEGADTARDDWGNCEGDALNE